MCSNGHFERRQQLLFPRLSLHPVLVLLYSTSIVEQSAPPTTNAMEETRTSSKARVASSPPKLQPQRAMDVSDPDSFQCWAHTRSGKRCTTLVKPREGEPIPVPYCDRHIKCGDYALRGIRHPIAGKCLVARWPLPAKYRIAFHGKRGKCLSCSKEDRAISFYPPNPKTGKNRDGNIVTNNYNGVLNPEGTGDLIQFAACPGPNERQNMR